MATIAEIVKAMDADAKMMFLRARDIMRKEEQRLERLANPPTWVACPRCGETVDKKYAPKQCRVCRLFVTNWSPYVKDKPGKLGVIRRRAGVKQVVKRIRRCEKMMTATDKNLIFKRGLKQKWTPKFGPNGEREKIIW